MAVKIKVLIICDDGECYPLPHLLTKDSSIEISKMETIDDDILYTDSLSPYFLNNEIDVIFLCDTFQQLSILQMIKLFKEKNIFIPIIVVSERNETGLAVEVIKSGGENFFVRNELTSEKVIEAVYSAMQTREEQKKIEKVQAENRKLSQTIEQSPVSVVITKAETNKIEYANPMFSKLTGYSLNEVIGLTPRILKSGLKSPNEYKDLWETILKGDTWKGEFVNRRKDGSLYCVAATISPIKINNDEPTHFVGIHEDITNQKKAELELKSYANMLETKTEELKVAYEAIDESIERAKRLHSHFFPTSFPQIDEIKLDAFYEPADKIGSDYYNFVKYNDQLIIYVVDVSGSGIAGAFINIFIRQKINRFLYVEEIRDGKVSPKALLNFLAKEFIKENFPEEYFICLYVAVLDLKTKQLTYSNAGIQVPPAIINNRQIKKLTLGGLPISATIDTELLVYEEESVPFNRDSTLIIATDGLVESVVDGQLYGIDRLHTLVAEFHYLPPTEIKKIINNDIEPAILSNYPNDDITYVIMQHSFSVIDKKEFATNSKCNDLDCIIKNITDWLNNYTNDVNSLLVGFNEMFYNAVEHGNKFDVNKQVKVYIEVRKFNLLITVEDEGEGFDWGPHLKKQLDIMNFQERGRGIIFSKASFDYITYNDKGNKVFLYKKL